MATGIKAIRSSTASQRWSAPRWSWLRRAYSIVLLLLLWEVLANIVAKPLFLPSLSSVIGDLANLVLSGEVAEHIAMSMFRALAGFTLAAVVGAGLGLLTGWYKKWDAFWTPLISLSYPAPKVALLPLLIVWLGIGELSKIAVIFMAGVYLTLIRTHAGVKGIDRTLVWKAQAMGATNREILLKVVVPHTLPHIFTGLRLTMAVSWALLYISEMVAARSGLGFLTFMMGQLLETKTVFAALLIIAALGFLFDRVIWFIFRRVCIWYVEPGEALSV